MRDIGMSPEIAHALQSACGDCHSYLIRWPWYSRLAPVSWVVRRDVARALEALNFSEWAAQNREKKAIAATSLVAACEALRDGTIPPRTYRLMYQEAQLSTH